MSKRAALNPSSHQSNIYDIVESLGEDPVGYSSTSNVGI